VEINLAITINRSSHYPGVYSAPNREPESWCTEESQMSLPKIALTCLCVWLLVLTPVRSQDEPKNQTPTQTPNQTQTAPTQPPQIPGFFDPKTGMFSTQAKAAIPTVAVATTSIIARLIFSFQIFSDNAGAATQCAVSLNVADAGGAYSESGSSRSPDGQNCTVIMLFSWDLATPQTDTINVQYSVNWQGGGGYRYTSHGLTPIPVPMNTETITLPTIHVTL
jgi:hypothetical protein